MSDKKATKFVVFNHKGGVGKTTLTTNLAFALNRLNMKVLLVDADPQANLTSYLIDAEVVDDLLDNSSGPNGATMWSAVKPLVNAEGDVSDIQHIELRNSLYLLPGDIQLAEFESELAGYWTDCYARKFRGFRGVSAISRIADSVAKRVGADVVLFDTGPNIGPLTQSILLDVDYFCIPAACDLFSTRAIKTLGHALAKWITDWKTISTIAPDGVPLLGGLPRIIGYIPQRFRVYGGVPTMDFSRVMPLLERAVKEDVIEVLSRIDPALVDCAKSPLKLGEIRDYGPRATGSQYFGRPIWETDIGAEYQRDQARTDFYHLALTVAGRMGLEAHV